MYVDANVTSYINRCREDSRKVRPVPAADRTGKRREQSEEKTGIASTRVPHHHHNDRPLEDEYESSEQGGFTGYGGGSSEQQEPRERHKKPASEAPIDPMVQKRLKEAYRVNSEATTDGFNTAA